MTWRSSSRRVGSWTLPPSPPSCAPSERRALRSLRRVGDLLDNLDEIAGDAAITPETVRHALELA